MDLAEFTRLAVNAAGGNPGAITVLAGLVNRSRAELVYVVHDTLGLRGASIWGLWRDVCDASPAVFDDLLTTLQTESAKT